MLDQEKQLLETLNGKMIDITLSEGVDTRLRRLATQGLIAKDELALFTKLMKDLDDGKTPTLPQRMMVMRIFDKLLKLIMDNKEVYQRVLQTVKKGKKVKKKPLRQLILSLNITVKDFTLVKITNLYLTKVNKYLHAT